MSRSFEVDRVAKVSVPVVPPAAGPEPPAAGASASALPALPDPDTRFLPEAPVPLEVGGATAQANVASAATGPLAADGAFADPGPSTPDQLRCVHGALGRMSHAGRSCQVPRETMAA